MYSSGHSFVRVALHELRVISADRSLWVVGGLLCALCTYAVYNGWSQTRVRDIEALATQAQERAAHANLQDQLRRVMSGEQAPEPWSNPTDPSLVGSMAARYALLPTGVLGPLAVGQSDMVPDTYKVTTQSRVEFMYDSEIENPWNLLMGRFDMAFVITYVLPLLILFWTYNCLSHEKEQGTLRMLLCQPIGLRTIALAKLAVRACLVLAATFTIPAAVLLMGRPEASRTAGLVQLGMWAGLCALYSLFWFALAALIDSLAKPSAFNALVLVSLWVLLVLVGPVCLNIAAAFTSPAPSRAELATQTRLITIDNLNRLADRFGRDYEHVQHPSSLLPKNGRFEVSERLRAFALAGQQLDERIDDALSEFDRKLTAQQRFVDRWGFLSPAVSVHEGMVALAGNGTARYQQFQRQVTAFHTQWKAFFLPRVFDGIAVDESTLSALPAWQWHEVSEPQLRAETWLRMLELAAISGILIWLAWWRLGRYPLA